MEGAGQEICGFDGFFFFSRSYKKDVLFTGTDTSAAFLNKSLHPSVL